MTNLEMSLSLNSCTYGHSVSTVFREVRLHSETSPYLLFVPGTATVQPSSSCSGSVFKFTGQAAVVLHRNSYTHTPPGRSSGTYSCDVRQRLMTRCAFHKSNPSSVPQGIVDSYSTLPWVTWEAVTVVESIP